MSSSVAATGEQNPQQNFNPSWMRHAFNRGGSGAVGATTRSSTTDEEYPIAPPILSAHRYDRDQLIKLKPKDSVPPVGLKECPFFVEISQQPIADTPLNELEVRLQNNINSSKAMSSLTHSERAAVAAGSAFGNGYTSMVGQSPKTPTADRGGWTPVKTTKQNTPERGRGGLSARGGHFSRGGRTPQSENGSVGINGSVPNTPDDGISSSFSKLCAMRRGAGTGSVGRGSSASSVTHNSRAEMLYSAGDNDHVKASTNTENDDEDEGWSSVGKPRKQLSNDSPRPAWTRTESWAQRTAESAMLRDITPPKDKKENVWKDRTEILESTLQPLSDGDKETNGKPPQSLDGAASALTETNPTHSDLTTTTSTTSQITTDDPNLLQQTTPVSVWGNVLNQGIPNIYNLQLLRQQQVVAQMAAQNSLVQAAAAKSQEQIMFYYLDPTETVRGPFSKEQMDAWYKAGYFSDESLQVKRGEKGEYKTIGKLVEINGKMTPFDYPDEKADVQNISMPPFAHPSTTSFPGIFGGGIWGTQNSSVDSVGMGFLVQSSIEKQVAAERQRIIEETNRRMKEQTEKLQQLQEEIIRQMAMQQQFSQQQLRDQENAILRHKEELQRKEQEMKEQALEMKKNLELQTLKLDEKRRALEAENARKLAEEKRLNEAKEKHRQEEARIMLAKKEAEERLKRAEEAAEMEKRRLAKEAETAAEKIRKLQQKAAEDIARNQKEKSDLAKEQQFEEVKAVKTSSRNSVADNRPSVGASESFCVEEKPNLSNFSNSLETNAPEPTKHTKVAPWAATIKPVENAQCEKTLREIQMEEERKMKAEQERLDKLKKEEQSQQSAIQAAGTWGSASSRLQWNQTNSSSIRNKSTSAIWSAPSAEQTKAVINPLFDGPSLEAANKIPAAKKNSAPKPTVKPTTSAKTVPPPKTAAKTKEEIASEALSQWFAKRFKQLASGKDEVDTSMLFSFVMELENPNEVEDIVMSYLDESKAVKEFVREFLKRRIEMRSGNRPSDVDDLSSARTVSAAPSTVNSGSSASGQGKKKKKNQKTVLDGNILGFRGTAASDRLNKGEIDAIPVAPVNPSRR